jgi:hypothetical protein
MNSSMSMVTEANDLQKPQDINVNVSSENLGSISVFVSSVLLSLGAFLSVIMVNMRKSRCVSISCGCSKCSRVVPDIEENDNDGLNV